MVSPHKIISALRTKAVLPLLILGGMAFASFLPPFLPSAYARGPFRVACWNVENLFDTIPAPHGGDADFTPDGFYHWDARRYWSKLGRLSRTLSGMGGAEPCALIGLVEVENDSVVYDLTRRTSLARLGYEAFLSHGPDVRGINVALLYQPLLFQPVSHDTLRVAPLTPEARPTRDILHVAGRLVTGDTLDVFVVHLPSRRGGKAADRYRLAVTQALAACADSIQHQRTCPLILMMGDFNAPASDPVFRTSLSAYTPLTSSLPGTYYFRQEWSQIDHFVVGDTLIRRFAPAASVYKAPHLLRATDTDSIPKRTFLGTHYQGGLSDHLPIILNLSL